MGTYSPTEPDHVLHSPSPQKEYIVPRKASRMDVSWQEDADRLRDEGVISEPITDPYKLHDIYRAFRDQVRRRLRNAQDDLKVLEQTAARHLSNFDALPEKERDQKYEAEVHKKDQIAIDKKIDEVQDHEDNLKDWEERIDKLAKELQEIEDKKAAEKAAAEKAKKAAADQKRARGGDEDPDVPKKKRRLSEASLAKVQAIASKLKDASSMGAVRAIIDDCADIAHSEELELSGEKDPEVSDPKGDITLDEDIPGLETLDDLKNYTEEAKNDTNLSKLYTLKCPPNEQMLPTLLTLKLCT